MSASWTTKEYYNIYPISSTDNFLMTLLPVLEIFPIKSFYNTSDYSQLLRFLLILCEISSAVVLSEKHTMLGARSRGDIYNIQKQQTRALQLLNKHL
jgi:hypothetical protein